MSREAKDGLFVDMCIYTKNTHKGVYVQYGMPCSDHGSSVKPQSVSAVVVSELKMKVHTFNLLLC